LPAQVEKPDLSFSVKADVEMVHPSFW
jgi:hypothetical protein